VCFEGKIVTNPVTIVCYACVLMGYWAGLFLGADREALEAGVNTMLEIAVKLTSKKKAKQSQVLLQDDQSGDQDA
jgi:hypothetical protein